MTKYHLLKKFRRHFYKLQKNYNKIMNSGNFGFSLSFNEGKLSQEIIQPENYPALMQFVTLMSPLLDDNNAEFYIDKIWNCVQRNYPYLNTKEFAEKFDVYKNRVYSSPFKIVYNNEELTREKIYSLINKGYFFKESKEIVSIVANLLKSQLSGMIHNQYYTFIIDIYHLVEWIFVMINSEEKRANSGILYPPLIKDAKCIYCKETDRTLFTSEEHVFPESLGNENLILPKGYVCDQCNNEVLSQLDSALADFAPIAFMRVVNVNCSKKGKFQKATFPDVEISRVEPNKILFKEHPNSNFINSVEDLDDGTTKIKFSLKQKFNSIKLARSLMKIGLGLFAIDHGIKKTCASKYDDARNFILNGEAFDNNLLMRMQQKPSTFGGAMYITQPAIKKGTIFKFNIFGIIFLINIEREPKLELVEPFLSNNFQLFNLTKNN